MLDLTHAPVIPFEVVARAGLHKPEDAILTLPATYLDTRNHGEHSFTLADVREKLKAGHAQTLCEVTVHRYQGFGDDKKVLFPTFQRKTRRLDVSCADRTGQHFVISCFGGIWDWKEIPVESQVMVTATKLERYGPRESMTAMPCSDRVRMRLGAIIPMYAGLPGVARSEVITQVIDGVVSAAATSPAVWHMARDHVLREAFCDERTLLTAAKTNATSLSVILRALHRPTSIEEAQLAREACQMVAAAAIQQRSRHFFVSRPASADCLITGIGHRVHLHIQRLKAQGLTLTNDQLNGVREIVHGLLEPRPSAVMINGDVGTGKTLTFLLPAIAAFELGKKVAVMAPTSILANQLAREIVDRFPGIPVTRLATGKKLKSGQENSILVSTHGMIGTTQKANWIPDVLVIDEQHKFPAAIREAMVNDHTHVIEATATPIPRSLAIALYAGIKQIILKESPVDKTLVSRLFVGDESRAEMNAVLSRVIATGAKIAFIYPAVDPTAAKEADVGAGDAPVKVPEVVLGPDGVPIPPKPPRVLANVKEAFERMHAMYPHRVACLFGNQSDEEKALQIDAVRKGEKQFIVASSMFEVGVDIPSLDAMVVRDADCFALSQLHQMRGRLARKGGTGHFLMFLSQKEEDINPKTIERLETLTQTTDGFRVAELDLDMRGFGDTAGDAQSGRVYTIFKGLKLRPRDFLKLAGGEAAQPTLAELETAQEVELAEATGQLSLI